MQSEPNPEFLRRAIALATKNVVSGSGGPFGAVIVRDGQIVAEAVNTVTATLDPTAHAEVNAIRAAAKTLGSFTLSGCQLPLTAESTDIQFIQDFTVYPIRRQQMGDILASMIAEEQPG